MMVGHLPAGYLISRWLAHCEFAQRCKPRSVMLAGMLGSVFPDFDMLYFHLIDHRQTHHHLYWTHLPIFWLAVLAACMVALTAFKQRVALLLVYVFMLNVFGHLLLDTIVGDIWWLTPMIHAPFAFFSVPALYKPWYLNFLLHWSFMLEIALVCAAVLMWRAQRVRT